MVPPNFDLNREQGGTQELEEGEVKMKDGEEEDGDEGDGEEGEEQEGAEKQEDTNVGEVGKKPEASE